MCRFFQSIYSMFLKADIIGPYPEISHYGNKRYATFPGAILSIGALAFVLYVFHEEFSFILYEKEPSVYSQLKPHPLSLQFDKSKTKDVYFQVKYYDLVSKSLKLLQKSDYPNIKLTQVELINGVRKEKSINSDGTSSFLTDCSDTAFDTYNDYNEPENKLSSLQLKQIQMSSTWVSLIFG